MDLGFQGNTRAGHDSVDRAEFSPNRANRIDYRGLIGDIADHGHVSPAGFESCCIETDSYDTRTFGLKCSSGLSADSGGTAGDEADFAPEPLTHVPDPSAPAEIANRESGVMPGPLADKVCRSLAHAQLDSRSITGRWRELVDSGHLVCR